MNQKMGLTGDGSAEQRNGMVRQLLRARSYPQGGGTEKTSISLEPRSWGHLVEAGAMANWPSGRWIADVGPVTWKLEP